MPSDLLRLTAAATAAIDDLVRARDLPTETALLVTVRGGGCCGLTYGMDLEPGTRAGHRELRVAGRRVLLDEEAVAVVGGTEIDFVDDGLNRGFVFRNPNAATTCGCGSSFAT